MTDQSSSGEPTRDDMTGTGWEIDDWPITDDHQVEPGHLPTPFTAAEIRDATPSGHTIETSRFAQAGDGSSAVTRTRITFDRCNRKGARMRTAAIDGDGVETELLAKARVTWAELRAHASFPAEAATRQPDRIRTPLGQLDCLRYTVATPNDRGDRQVFWFSREHPGMPIRFGTERDGKFVDITTIVAVR